MSTIIEILTAAAPVSYTHLVIPLRRIIFSSYR